jgi:anti-anti-sigma factor
MVLQFVSPRQASTNRFGSCHQGTKAGPIEASIRKFFCRSAALARKCHDSAGCDNLFVLVGSTHKVLSVSSLAIPARSMTATVWRKMSGSISIVVRQEQDHHRTLKLSGDINVFLATELHRCCVQISAGASSITVDCDQVTSIDIAALQIIVALNDTLVARGGTFGISGLSKEVKETIDLAGLAKRLGLSSGSVTKGGTE